MINQPSTHPQPEHSGSAKFSLPILIIVAVLPQNQAIGQDLEVFETLDAESQAAVKRLCLPLEFQASPEDYRSCVQSWSQQLQDSGLQLSSAPEILTLEQDEGNAASVALSSAVVESAELERVPPITEDTLPTQTSAGSVVSVDQPKSSTLAGTEREPAVIELEQPRHTLQETTPAPDPVENNTAPRDQVWWQKLLSPIRHMADNGSGELDRPAYFALIGAILAAGAALLIGLWWLIVGRSRGEPKAIPAPMANRYDAFDDRDILGETLRQTLPRQLSQETVIPDATREQARPSVFATILSSLPAPEHRRYCTEFLLYWMSYSDGNYNAALQQRLQSLQQPGPHDLIKKQILAGDVDSLDTALKAFKKCATPEQHEQTIKLMLTILVRDRLSPVQNLFLRFLADYLAIGSEGLADIYQQLFQHQLPGAPRPDDERWWKQNFTDQEEELSILYEPETEREILLHRLGLSDPATEADIAERYRELEARCAPQHYNLLGSKEQKLVERHLAKFEKAFLHLTGHSV